MSSSTCSIRYRRRLRPAAGFTLVELLVVIGIIALLISILLPALNKAREQGQKTACLSNLRSFGQLLSIYASENKGRAPIGYAGTKHAGYMVNQAGTYEVLGCLSESGLLRGSPNAFYCPSKEDPRWKFNTPENPWPPPAAANQLCRLGMTVRPAVQFKGRVPQTSTWDQANNRGKFPQISLFRDKAIAAEMFGEPVNAAYAVDPTLTPHKRYINVLYADNSAMGVETTGIDGADNESIATLLKKLAIMATVPTGQAMNDIYLDELVTPNKGIWHKFDAAR